MIFVKTLAFLLYWTSLSVLCADQRNVTRTLSVPNPAQQFGTWHGAQHCAHHLYAHGFQLKVEPWQHARDDSGLNAIKLFCGDLEDVNAFGGDIMSGEGRDGSFYEKKMCNDGDFLVGFELNVQKSHVGDDWAAINVRFYCRKISGGTEYRLDYPFLHHEAGLGQWTGFSGSCPPGSAICGIKTKIDDRGHFGLVDADFDCCT